MSDLAISPELRREVAMAVLQGEAPDDMEEILCDLDRRGIDLLDPQSAVLGWERIFGHVSSTDEEAQLLYEAYLPRCHALGAIRNQQRKIAEQGYSLKVDAFFSLTLSADLEVARAGRWQHGCTWAELLDPGLEATQYPPFYVFCGSDPVPPGREKLIHTFGNRGYLFVACDPYDKIVLGILEQLEAPLTDGVWWIGREPIGDLAGHFERLRGRWTVCSSVAETEAILDLILPPEEDYELNRSA